MTRVTYGVASSAFHSIRCLQEVVHRSGGTVCMSPILTDFHVNDFLSGASSVEEVNMLVDTVSQQLLKHGFPWTSSHPEISLNLPENLGENKDETVILDSRYKIETL